MSDDLAKYNHLKYRDEEAKASDDFVDFLVKVTHLEAPEIDENKAWKKLEHKISRSSRSTLWLRVAASVALVVAVTFLMINFGSTSDMQKIASLDEKKEVTFPDGSLGVLNTSSSFVFPEKFGNERRVSFTGEAYFDIRKSKKPFVIDANGVEVKVLGTAFNLITTTSEVRLYVDHGVVAFVSDDDETEVTAGMEAIFDKETATVLIAAAPTENVMSWRNGYFKFEDTPLSDAVKELSEYYEIDFQLSSSKLNSCRISATIDQQSLGEVLGLLEKILDVKVALKGEAVKISGKGC